MDETSVLRLFSPSPDTIYLDTATYGLPPRPTVDALQQALAAWQAGSADWVADWDRRGEECRTAFAGLLGSPSDRVALLPTVSVGVGTIAAALQSTDEVLVPDDEFTSVLYPLRVAEQQRGVRIKAVPLGQLAASITRQTTLVAFSLIQSQSGRGPDLEQVIASARASGARVLVDVTHALPFVDLSAHIDQIDYLVRAGYKHLLCPRGVAFLYVSPSHWTAIPPVLANWRSAPDPYGHFYGGELQVAPNAARFDVSLAWFAWVGGAISLRLLLDWQQQGLLDGPVRLVRELAHALSLAEPPGTVLSVPVTADADTVRAELARRGVRASVRAGSVRLSTHVYNTRAHIERAVEAIGPFARLPARA